VQNCFYQAILALFAIATVQFFGVIQAFAVTPNEEGKVSTPSHRHAFVFATSNLGAELAQSRVRFSGAPVPQKVVQGLHTAQDLLVYRLPGPAHAQLSTSKVVNPQPLWLLNRSLLI
jgi:hypothetical protein